MATPLSREQMGQQFRETIGRTVPTSFGDGELVSGAKPEGKYYDDHMFRARALVRASAESGERVVREALLAQAEKSARKYADEYVYDMASGLDLISRMAAQDPRINPEYFSGNFMFTLSDLATRGPAYLSAVLWSAAVWRVAYDRAMNRQPQYDNERWGGWAR